MDDSAGIERPAPKVSRLAHHPHVPAGSGAPDPGLPARTPRIHLTSRRLAPPGSPVPEGGRSRRTKLQNLRRSQCS